MSKPRTGSPLSEAEQASHERVIALHRDESRFLFQLKPEIQSALTHGALRALFRRELESPIAETLVRFESEVVRVAKSVARKNEPPDDAKLDDEYRKRILNELLRARFEEEIGA